MIVSQQKNRKINLPINHNIILTITSYSNKRNLEVADKFEQETRIVLDFPVPDWFKKNFEMLNISFRAFEKDPEAAMAFLMKFGK